MQNEAKLLRIALAAMAAMWLAGCSPSTSYNAVNDGKHGPTSPADSGQYGESADIHSPYGDAAKAKAEDIASDITQPITNGFADPTMEGSGNIAAQGDYTAEQEAKQAKEAASGAMAGANKDAMSMKPATANNIKPAAKAKPAAQ